MRFLQLGESSLPTCFPEVLPCSTGECYDLFPLGATAITTGFQNSVGTILLDNVACTGSEARLLDCMADPLGMFDCIDTENAGVRCELGKSYTAPVKS